MTHPSRALFIFSTLSLLLAGCSESLQGFVYQRGTVSGEFHYPSVQYGYIESISEVDETGRNGVETDVISANSENKADVRLYNSRLSSQTLSSPPAKVEAQEKNGNENLSKENRSFSSATEVTRKIRELGVYNFSCNKNEKQEQECVYAPESGAAGGVASLASMQTKLLRLKVRLDNGKEYWFKQPVTPGWKPQPADRIKLFFSEEPAASVTHALKVQLAIPAPESATQSESHVNNGIAPAPRLSENPVMPDATAK